VTQVVQWRTVEDAIRRWFVAATELSVIWENQRAPQPAYPYGSLAIMPGSFSSPIRSEQTQKTDGSIRLRRQLDFTVACSVHVGAVGGTHPECDARGLIDTAMMHLDTPGQSGEFEAASIGVRGPLGATQNLDLLVGGQWISRARADIRFGVAAILENVPATQPGWFDKVQVASNFSGLHTPGDPAPLDFDRIFDPANP